MLFKTSRKVTFDSNQGSWDNNPQYGSLSNHSQAFPRYKHENIYISPLDDNHKNMFTFIYIWASKKKWRKIKRIKWE